MKVRRGQLAGAVGGEVYVSTKGGQVVRSRPGRSSPATTARMRVWAGLGSVASMWRTLTADQFAAWAVAGKKERLGAYRFYCKINGTLAAYGQPLVKDPPKREKLRSNPVGSLEIRNRGGVIRLRLRVARAPAELTFVFGVGGCSRGVSVPRRRGVLLGPLPKAVNGWSDISELYLGRFRTVQAGSRVSIWTRQVVNGRRDALKQAWADVPAPEGRQ
jgi:hypothetical protein